MLDLYEGHSSTNNNESNIFSSNISDVGVKFTELKTNNSYGNKINKINTKLNKGFVFILFF